MFLSGLAGRHQAGPAAKSETFLGAGQARPPFEKPTTQKPAGRPQIRPGGPGRLGALVFRLMKRGGAINRMATEG